MSNQHQLRMAAARCLSLLQRYHQGERTDAEQARMVAEVELIIGWLLEVGPPAGATEAWVLAPVESNLVDQYGDQAGRRLYREFVEAFDRAGMPLTFKDRYGHFNCIPR